MTNLDWQLPASLVSLLQSDTATVESLIPVPSVSHDLPKPEAATSTPFLAALKTLPDTTTYNGAAAFTATGSALVDLFANLAPGVGAVKVFKLLPKAWAEDKEATLKIIFHTRSIHEGKGAKFVFFRCVAWLWEYHPRTLLAKYVQWEFTDPSLELIVQPTCERRRSKRNAAKEKGKVEVLDEKGDIEEVEYPPRPHGSFDDLNDILVMAVNGQLTTTYKGKLDAVDEALAPARARVAFKPGREGQVSKRKGFRIVGKGVRKHAREEGEGEEEEDLFRDKLARCGTKKMRDAVIAERAIRMLADVKLQALYLTIVGIYARYIRADLEKLANHKDYLTRSVEDRKADGYGKPDTSPFLFGMSYAAKWAPTPGKSADKQLLLASALALKLFPNDDTKKARQRLQSEVLTPLRRVLAVPEVNMVHGSWKIDYPKVPSLAMRRYQDQFVIHDSEGFDKFLNNVAMGKATISGASLEPHVLVHEVIHGGMVRARVANAQWDTLVDSIRSSSDNELSNCIAVADVSGSMGSLHRAGDLKHPAPILPCIALTLLLTELARPPWNGAFITFSQIPLVAHVDVTQPLRERVMNLSRASWGFSTNYALVFDGILTVAKQNNLAPEEMVKKVFVFSDMQFDSSVEGNYGETEHQAIRRRFEEAGYEMPEMVYWNLAGVPAQPVQAGTEGTALVSGYSGALLKYFIRSISGLEGGDEVVEDVKKEKEEDDDWEKVDGDSDQVTLGGEVDVVDKVVETEKKVNKEKVKLTPLDHLMATIGAKPFDSVRVVD